MCGIVGAFTFDKFEKKAEEKARTEANIFITTQLLQATVDRGKDATGISLLWGDGNYTGLKMGIPSPEFIARFGTTEKDFEGILKLWREYPKLLKVFMGHCRKSSVGNSYDNKNNHPIQIGDIIMCHNGTLTNHENIFDKLKSKRIGDVDSEAIGQLLHHYTNGGTEPFTVDIIKETTRRLQGTYSVLAMSGNNPYQVAQFRDGRPAEMVLVRPLKMVFVASEKKFLETVLFEYNKQAKLFSSAANLPYITKADVQFKMLQDDSLALWDLTAPVNEKTDIEDLYTWEKVPMRVDKVWETTTTTTNTYQNRNTGGTTKKKSTTSGTVVTASQKKKSEDGKGSVTDEQDPDGLVWSRSLNKYKTQTGIEKSKDMGAVVVDVETGKLVVDDNTDDSSDDTTFDLKEVTPDRVENLIVSGAETTELALKRNADTVEKKSSNDETDQTPTEPGKTVEVDMTADPEALKKAEEFIEDGLIKYENDEEVAGDLDISDVAVLNPLPLYALANRIKKFIFKLGFIAGYVARKKEVPNTTTLPGPGKLDNAEQKIRGMKVALKVMAECLEMRCRGNTIESIEVMIETAILAVVDKPQKINLSSSFSVGDLKNIPMLREIKEKMHKD